MGGALGGETALRSVGPLQVTPNQQGQKAQGPVLAPERTGMQLSPLPSKCCHPLTQLGPELEMKQDSVESNGLERWCHSESEQRVRGRAFRRGPIKVL